MRFPAASQSATGLIAWLTAMTKDTTEVKEGLDMAPLTAPVVDDAEPERYSRAHAGGRPQGRAPGVSSRDVPGRSMIKNLLFASLLNSALLFGSFSHAQTSSRAVIPR